MRKLLSALPPSESSNFRVDFRSDHVHYLNNLEVDVMYKRWRSNLNEVPCSSDLWAALFGIIFISFSFSNCLHLSALDLDASLPRTIALHPEEPLPCSLCFGPRFHLWAWGKLYHLVNWNKMFLCSFVFELVLCCFHPIKGDLWVKSFSKICRQLTQLFHCLRIIFQWDLVWYCTLQS